MYKRLMDVPNRLYDVVLYRSAPGKMQSNPVVVASFHEEARALAEAGRREGDGKGRYEVLMNENATQRKPVIYAQRRK